MTKQATVTSKEYSSVWVIQKLREEVNFLMDERLRLKNAINSVTVIEKRADGSVVIGPRGYELLQAAVQHAQ